MYGLIVSFGILSSLLVGEKIIKEKNLEANIYWRASLWAILGGVAGARIYHVIDHWEVYSINPITVLFIQSGGLAIYGALIGSTISLVTYLYMTKSDVLVYLDVAAIVVPLGQSVGRWGNFANMEIIGSPTRLPWGMYVPPAYRPLDLIYNDFFHPAFLYESLLDILLFSVLWLLYRRKIVLRKKGRARTELNSLKGFFTLVYMVGYGLIRFSLEFVRLDPWQINGVNIAQLISLIFAFSGILGLILLYRRAKA